MDIDTVQTSVCCTTTYRILLLRLGVAQREILAETRNVVRTVTVLN
jgi:hypothetical protein